MPTFADLGLPAALTAVLAKQGIDEPFAIQAATLPDALAGHDVCGRAPTGSGKTLAFGLPLIAGLAAADGWSKPGRPQALILLPTRELAAQVTEVLAPLARAVGAQLAAVYGGVGYHPQRTALRKGVDLLIGCPGRLEDLIAQGDLDLSDVRWVVLDEADRMADMGFLPAVKRMLDQVSPARQMLLFSATLDGDVDVVIRRYLDRPRRHEVDSDQDDTGDVTHLWWRTTRDRRIELTAELVRSHAPAIVFTRTRHGADRLTKRLEAAGLTAAPVHGARSQPQRDKALAAFVAGRVDALVATDVAARGIHVDAVACVIHFDPPGDSKDYTHRSGRTGRAGADGLVVSMVTDDVKREVASLQRGLGHPKGATEPDFGALPAAPPRAAPKPMPPTRPSGPGGAAARGRPAPPPPPPRRWSPRWRTLRRSPQQRDAPRDSGRHGQPGVVLRWGQPLRALTPAGADRGISSRSVLLGADPLTLDERLFDVARGPVLFDVGLDLLQDLLGRGLEIDAGQVHLPGDQPGAPIDLVAIAFGIIEVDPDGVAVADLHVERNLTLTQAVVEGDDIVEGVTAPRDLLHHLGVARGRPPGGDEELMVLDLGPAAHEGDAHLGLRVGDLEPDHVAVERHRPLGVLDVDADVGQATDPWGVLAHVRSPFDGRT
jgi:superfamily II DNA/RNA helicase